jgi:hypothetical protein
MNTNRYISSCTPAIAFLLLSSLMVVAGVSEPTVYGEPGVNQIQVRVFGDRADPGIYWLSKGTKLPELVERAHFALPTGMGVEHGSSYVLVDRTRNGKSKRFRFARPPLFDKAGKAASFILEDGDEVRFKHAI